jgi:hypothetical protein
MKRQSFFAIGDDTLLTRPSREIATKFFSRADVG